MSDKVMETDTIKEMVRARYGDIAARAGSSCCAPAASSCCEPAVESDFDAKAREIGYSDEELAAVPEVVRTTYAVVPPFRKNCWMA